MTLTYIVLAVIGLLVVAGFYALSGAPKSSGQDTAHQPKPQTAALSEAQLEQERAAERERVRNRFEQEERRRQIGEPFDLSFTPRAIPPKFQQVETTSFASGGIYRMDLRLQTCTCPDFTERRHRYEVNTMPRLCKHLMMQLRSRKAFEDCNDWLKAIAKEHRGGPMKAWLVTRKDSPPALVAKNGDTAWLSVYARNTRKGERIAQASGPIREFGWSVTENRWARSESPAGAREMVAIFKRVFGD